MKEKIIGSIQVCWPDEWEHDERGQIAISVFGTEYIIELPKSISKSGADALSIEIMETMNVILNEAEKGIRHQIFAEIHQALGIK